MKAETKQHRCQGGGETRRCGRYDTSLYVAAEEASLVADLLTLWLCAKHAQLWLKSGACVPATDAVGPRS